MAQMLGASCNELTIRAPCPISSQQAFARARVARRAGTGYLDAHSMSRQLSHRSASTSARDAGLRGRCRSVKVCAALFEPPPFQPSKLSVQYIQGATAQGPLPPNPRCYTLTHNDITGALQLSIGPHVNKSQVHGFYTRLLRDEVIAKWVWCSGKPQLHIHCHVSGEEKWLAPPQLRNYVFRREMTLVLDTLCYADRALLRAHPQLEQARIYIHFQSHKEDLDLVEAWGVLGARDTWQRVPAQPLERLKLLLFGFPSNPQQRQRQLAAAEWERQQQEHQQQQQQGLSAAGLQPAVAVVAVDVQPVQQQGWMQEQGEQGADVAEAEKLTAAQTGTSTYSDYAEQSPPGLHSTTLQLQEGQQGVASVRVGPTTTSSSSSSSNGRGAGRGAAADVEGVDATARVVVLGSLNSKTSAVPLVSRMMPATTPAAAAAEDVGQGGSEQQQQPGREKGDLEVVGLEQQQQQQAHVPVAAGVGVTGPSSTSATAVVAVGCGAEAAAAAAGPVVRAVAVAAASDTTMWAGSSQWRSSR